MLGNASPAEEHPTSDGAVLCVNAQRRVAGDASLEVHVMSPVPAWRRSSEDWSPQPSEYRGGRPNTSAQYTASRSTCWGLAGIARRGGPAPGRPGSAKVLNGLTGVIIKPHPLANGWYKVRLDSNEITPHLEWSVPGERLLPEKQPGKERKDVLIADGLSNTRAGRFSS
jgi:hypothetical protein